VAVSMVSGVTVPCCVLSVANLLITLDCVTTTIDLDKKTGPTAAGLLACALNICHAPVHSFRFH